MNKIKITNVEDIKSVCGYKSDEKETNINMFYDDNKANLSTNDNTWITKMKKRLVKNPNEFECYCYQNEKGEIDSYSFIFPRKYVRIGTKTKTASEKTKQAASERFKKMWKNKNN